MLGFDTGAKVVIKGAGDIQGLVIFYENPHP